jgi:hypothetical protein
LLSLVVDILRGSDELSGDSVDTRVGRLFTPVLKESKDPLPLRKATHNLASVCHGQFKAVQLDVFHSARARTWAPLHVGIGMDPLVNQTKVGLMSKHIFK